MYKKNAEYQVHSLGSHSNKFPQDSTDRQPVQRVYVKKTTNMDSIALQS